MPIEARVTRETLSADVVFLVQCIRDSAREGRSTHMIEMRNSLGAAVTLGFSDYLRFLRHFSYVALSSEHVLSLAPSGQQLADTATAPDLDSQLTAFFADKLSAGIIAVPTADEAQQEIDSIDVDLTPAPSRPSDSRLTVSPALQPPRRVVPEVSTSSEEWTYTVPISTPASRRGSLLGDLVTPSPGKPPVQPDAPTPTSSSMVFLPGDQIGRGPLGRVMRARHAVLLVDMAIKELVDPGAEGSLFTARIKREVALQARLRHPTVVGIHGLELSGSPVRVIEELCDGGNLRMWLTTAKPGAQKILRAFTQLLDGLAAADAEGFSHGNIKAENVLFDRFGNAKLSDFGFSRIVSVGPDHGIKGDLYALGVLMYAALTGMRFGPTAPFASKVVPAVPAAMDWIIERLTAEDPAARYADATQAREAMLAALADPSYGGPCLVPVLTGFPAAETARSAASSRE